MPPQKFDTVKIKQLNVLTRNKSIRYEDSEFADLPPVVHDVKRFQLPEEAEEYYRRYLDILRNAKNDVKEIENSFLRMRQISSGFLNVRVDDEKGVIEFPYNPRLELLETIIDGIAPEKKVIIFNHFVRSGNYIAQMLTKKKIKWCRLGGGAKDPRAQIRRFQEDPEYTHLIMQPTSGGAGLNPQYVCHHGIYYETPTNPIDRKQTWKRIIRTGQKHRVYFWDLVCKTKGSLDEGILSSLETGEDLFDAICSGRRTI